MEFNWEEFEEGQVPDTKNRIHVTINRRCKFFFNQRTLEALGDPDGISLMYDRRKSVIGVKPTPLNRQSTYRLYRKQIGGKRPATGRLISAKNFCRRYSISPEETLAFPNAEIRDGILILDMNEVRSVKRS